MKETETFLVTFAIPARVLRRVDLEAAERLPARVTANEMLSDISVGGDAIDANEAAVPARIAMGVIAEEARLQAHVGVNRLTHASPRFPPSRSPGEGSRPSSEAIRAPIRGRTRSVPG